MPNKKLHWRWCHRRVLRRVALRLGLGLGLGSSEAATALPRPLVRFAGGAGEAAPRGRRDAAPPGAKTLPAVPRLLRFPSPLAAAV